MKLTVAASLVIATCICFSCAEMPLRTREEAVAKKEPALGAFRRNVVKEVPVSFSATPIVPAAKPDHITIFVRGDVVRLGLHEIPAGATVESLVHANYGPDFMKCDGTMTIFRKEKEEIVLYSASGSGLATEQFRLLHGDRIFYSQWRRVKKANKAPEPTPGSVTPRAIEGVSK